MFKKLIALALTLLMLLCPLSVFAAEDAEPVKIDGVSSVVANKKGTRLSIEVTLSDSFLNTHRKATVYLFELGFGRSVSDINSLSPVASFRATASHKHSLPLTSLYCGYVVAVQTENGTYSPIGSARYLDNVTSLATNLQAYPTVSSIKGLAVTSISDALALGISHAVLPVAVESMFATDPADALPYDLGGVTYYFDRTATEALDDKVASLSRAGVRVYLRFQLDTAPASLTGQLAALGYPNAPAAPHYAIRVDTPESATMMASLLSFLAARYTAEDGQHGFCGSFIIGNAVNLPSINYSTDPATTNQAHVENYAYLLRLAYTAMASVYSEGRVFASISNNFSIVPAGLAEADVESTKFLSELCAATARGGDFDWGIATDAYSYSRDDVTIWDDVLATGASSTLISPTNISVLTTALAQAYTYNDTPRRLIIGNFAVASAEGDTADAHRAASYAYAYYKALEDGNVEALIYANQFSDPSDATGYGLSATDMSGNVIKKGQVWNVMRAIDTPDTDLLLSICSQAGGVVQYMFTTMSQSAAVKNISISGGQAYTALPSGTKLTELFDFSGGERGGFVASGYGYSTQPPLVRVDDGSALRLEGADDRAVVNYGVARSYLNSANQLAVILSDCTDGTLTLRLSQGDTLIYSASASIDSSTGVVIFDVKQFRKLMSSGQATMSLQVSRGASASVSSINIARVTTMSSVLWMIVLAFGVLFLLMLALGLFTRLYHRHRRSISEKRTDDQ